MTQGQFLSGVSQVWIQSFLSPWLVASPRLKNISLSYYLPIAGGRILGFIPFPGVLVQCEMQSVSSRIWTHVTGSISYDDNHYTTGTNHHHHCTSMYVSDDTCSARQIWGCLLEIRAVVCSKKHDRQVLDRIIFFCAFVCVCVSVCSDDFNWGTNYHYCCIVKKTTIDW